MTKISTLGKMKSNDVILKSGQSWYHGSKYIYIFIYIYIYIYIFPISNNTPEAMTYQQRYCERNKEKLPKNGNRLIQSIVLGKTFLKKESMADTNIRICPRKNDKRVPEKLQAEYVWRWQAKKETKYERIQEESIQ